MSWLKEYFGTEKPIICSFHLRALPGDPRFGYDVKSMDEVVEIARRDMHAFQDGGIDAIMFSNEFSMPYKVGVEPVTTACMARIIGELKSELKIPFGTSVTIDPMGNLDLAAATGAVFMRDAFTGVHSGEFGVQDPKIGDVARRKEHLGLHNVKTISAINPEGTAYMSVRKFEDIVKTTAFHCSLDSLAVSGVGTGQDTPDDIIIQVKNIVGDFMPVFANTGCTMDTIERKLSICDGAVVGTTFKVDGKFENHVDPARVKAFMDKVKAFRGDK